MNLTEAGTLSKLLTADEMQILKRLTLSGEINSSDICTIREIHQLEYLNLSNTTIVEYTGIDGLSSDDVRKHLANTIPLSSFYQSLIRQIILPSGMTLFEGNTFSYCPNLESMTIPASVEQFGQYDYSGAENLKYFRMMNAVPIKLPYGELSALPKTIPLYVPIGSKSLYESAPGWNIFTNIIEIDEAIKELPTKELNLTSLSSSKNVEITTKAQVTAVSDADWLHVSLSNSDYSSSNSTINFGSATETTTTVWFVAATNTGSVERTTSVLINSGIETKVITITQAALLMPNIELSTQTIDFTSTNTAKTTVTTTGNWSATSNQTWITITPASGTGTGEISITAEPNTTGATRTATITVASKLKANGETKTITVTQAPTTTATAETQATATNLLYPNPASSSISIPTTAAARVFVYNSTGQLVLSKDIAGKEDVNIEALTAGLYKVCVETAAGVAVYSVVKK